MFVITWLPLLLGCSRTSKLKGMEKKATSLIAARKQGPGEKRKEREEVPGIRHSLQRKIQ